MGSSSGGSSRQPSTTVPAGLISQPGQTPFTPNYVNFLGDPSTPSVGLSPAMLAAIEASNRPSAAPAAGGSSGELEQMRQQLAQLMNQQQGPSPRERFFQRMTRHSGFSGGGGGHSPGYGGRGV